MIICSSCSTDFLCARKSFQKRLLLSGDVLDLKTSPQIVIVTNLNNYLTGNYKAVLGPTILDLTVSLGLSFL